MDCETIRSVVDRTGRCDIASINHSDKSIFILANHRKPINRMKAVSYSELMKRIRNLQTDGYAMVVEDYDLAK